MITNVESLVQKAKKERFQHNMPVELPTSQLDFYIKARQPDPGLGSSEPYNESDILPASVDDDPRQIILYEMASSTDAIATEYRRLKAEKKALMDEYRSDLKRYWSVLMNLPKIAKIFYKPEQKKVWLPLRRTRMRDGFRTVMQKVKLQPRQIPWTTRITYTVMEHGHLLKKHKRITVLKWIVPYVWREVRRPKFKYITLRVAGFYLRKVRTKTIVRVHDWVTIRSKYAAYKLDRIRDLRPRLESIKKRFDALKDMVKKRGPRHMVSWTTHGFVRPYQPGESPVRKAYQIRSVEHRATTVEYPWTEWEFYSHSPWQQEKHGAFIYYSPGYGPIADQGSVPPNVSAAQEQWFSREHYLSMTGAVNAIPPFQRGQGTYRFVGSPSFESQAKLAYSTIQSLTKAKDYQFQWFRSLVELKDMKQSLATIEAITNGGVDFIKWVATIKTMDTASRIKISTRLKALGAKFGSGLRLLAAAYLTFKFAIEPTKADIDTVIGATTDWLFEIRRALSSILTDPNSRLNTYHARAKYGDSIRDLKLGRDVDLMVDDQSFELSVPCVVRWPSFIWRQFGNYPRHTDPDSYTAELSGPNHIEEDGWYDFPSVTSKISVAADSGYFEHPLSVDGVRHHSWWGTNPLAPDVLTHRHQLYGPIHPSMSQKEIEDWIMHCTFNNSPVVERVPVYMRTWKSGVVFGEYRLDDLLSLLSQPGSSSPELRGLLQSVYDGACDLLTRLDIVKTSWELTPLSFVYDWFTDSSTLVTTLANMARSNWTIYNQVPVAKYGIWESQRTELLAGTAMYQFAGCECLEYISSSRIDTACQHWTWNGFSPLLRPIASHRRYRLRFNATNDKVRIMRTGLYRVRRGEQTGYSDIVSYMPHVSVSVSGGKILSLSALITSLFGGNGR